MANIRRVIPCKCGVQNTFNVDTELELEDVSVTGKCPSCGTVVHISVSALLKPAPLEMKKEAGWETPGLDDKPAQTSSDYSNIEDALSGMFRS